MPTQTLPPVFLNHFYLVIDSATYKDIEQSAFLRNELAVTEQRTTVRTDRSYTGLYFYGTNTYFEFFDVANATPRQRGDSGIAFGVDQPGELEAIDASLDHKLITRQYNSKQIPWFYAAEHKDLAIDSSLGVWLMEYHPSFLNEWNPQPGASNQGTSRKQILQRYTAVLEDAPRETYFEDVIALTLAIDEARRKTFVEFCKQLGYREHAADVLQGPDMEFRLLPQTPETRGIQQITMRAKRKANAEFRFGTRSVLTFRDDGVATWSF
ncbi:MAG TPA: DUF5829 family protein [Pyrinomonadaceae bacterium]|nr:DUF5829 family protein [Pyrinomonadaceae bacterium]